MPAGGAGRTVVPVPSPSPGATMHHRMLPVLAVAAALAVPAAAQAAQPKPGYCEGPGVFFKMSKFSDRAQLSRLSLSEPLTCADGTTIQDSLDTILILGPKVNRNGRFRYERPGKIGRAHV